MQTAPIKPKGMPASPAISAASVESWEAQTPSIQDTLEREIYGVMPRKYETEITARRGITEHNYPAIIEEFDLKTSYIADNGAQNTKQPVTYTAVLVTPKSVIGPVPIIMMENFCPNHSVVPIKGISRPLNLRFSCDGDGMAANLMTYFFGRYITTPPIEMIVNAGFGIAIIHPPANFPDNPQAFESQRSLSPNKQHQWGAIGAWAYQFSSLSDALQTLGYDETIAYGHSRYGKAALVATAYDGTIDGVIAHQSGTGGASLSRNKKGETVADITKNYPHWYTPAYSEDSLTYDQHHLLALIAPRPIMLGNAKRDVWSDPEGAFRAAQGATPIYELYGKDGLLTTKLTSFDPSADIAFWMRPGTHGVVKEDWPAFLEFMNAHFN